jgi:hypothetical protein
VSHFKGSFFVTIISLILAALWGLFKGGPSMAIEGVFIAAILGILEVSLSFDNAVVNAGVLDGMDPKWQRRFLTWGIFVAVFGMRVVFPVVIVSVVASLDPITVLNIAFTRPEEYARHLAESHAVISSFGGMFLLMVFLKFILDPEKEVHWIDPIERQLIKIGKLEAFEIVISLVVLLVTQSMLPAEEKLGVLISGMVGLITYIAVDGVSSYMEGSEGALVADGIKKGGIAMFLYLELLDASFSFDGVIGAFAITNDVVTIALGLGIGAMFVRSLTLFLVKKGTLAEYIYLEHGAHYAIGLLAILMMVGIKIEIPEIVTGLSGVFFIGLALISSIAYNKKHRNEEVKEA